MPVTTPDASVRPNDSAGMMQNGVGHILGPGPYNYSNPCLTFYYDYQKGSGC